MLPQPSHQFINWFYEENQKKSLILQPKYQRNPVWSDRQKCFLLDSILTGIPIGQIFLNVVTKGKGLSKKSFYEVVDGQQRLRTILDFMRDDLTLVAVPVSMYPVSGLYGRLVGKKYSDLSDELQDKIWNYPVAVQELREYSDKRIRDMFRRLNYVVERLTKQELRHSQFFGEFAKAVENLADNPFWEKAGLFSRKDYQRMGNLEFLSELLIVVISGIQDQQKTIDQFYAKFDSSFPSRATYLKQFERVLDHLSSFLPLIESSRFSKKAKIKRASNKLKKLARALKAPPDSLGGTARAYSRTVVEGPNKLAKRKKRTEILQRLMRSALAEN